MKLLFYSRSRFARRAFSVKSLFSPSFFPPKLTAIKGRCGKVKARQFSDQLQRREALEDTHIKEEQTRRDESDIFVSNPWLTFANKDFPVTLKRLSYFTIINENQIDIYSVSIYFSGFFLHKIERADKFLFYRKKPMVDQKIETKSHIKKCKTRGRIMGPQCLKITQSVAFEFFG